MDDAVRIIDAYLDCQLDEQRFQELHQWLLENPQAPKLFAQWCLLHHQIIELYEVDAYIKCQTSVVTRKSRSRPWATFSLIAASVLLVAACAVAVLVFRSQPADRIVASKPIESIVSTVATLTDISNDAVFADSTSVAEPLKLGEALPPGPIKLTSGNAQIMFASDAVVDLAGPCEFEMTGPNRGRLVTGSLNAYIPQRAHGFILDLPSGARIVDLGTRFSVMINSDGSERVYVFEGLVEVAFAQESLRASAGQTLNITAAGVIAHAALIGSYSFTGHALTPTDADALDGITFSNFVVGAGFGDLTDNSAPANALRISGNDGTPSDTGDAFTNDAVFSFTITVAAGWTLNLTSIAVDNEVTDAFGYSFARVYSSAQGTDDLTNDRIDLVGRNSAGSDGSIQTDTINLDTPAANTEPGVNNSATDFNLTGPTSITFFLPWIDDSGVNTRYTDLHEVRINGVAAEVPTPAALPADVMKQPNIRQRVADAPAKQPPS